MNINISDRKLFLSGFLSPLGKISDSCVINLNDNGFDSLVCTSDASIILSTSYKLNLDIDTPIHLNIADIKKIIKVLDCIPDDSITLTLDKNNITYNNKGIKFRYHLLEDGIITIPKINLKKIDEIQFPVKFTFDYKALLDLLRGSTFATDSNKVYIYSDNGKVLGDLTDRARHNIDSFTTPLCEYSGPELQPICLNFELIRIISGVRVKQLDCLINPKLGVIIFQINSGSITTKYIASSLIK